MYSFNSAIIIACDFSSKEKLFSFLKKFPNKKLFLKLGMELIYKEGFGLIKELKNQGHNIFLDLKIYDIPNTSVQALKSLLTYGIDFVTVHTLMGKKTLTSLIDLTKNTPTNLIGVSLLTSYSEEDIKEIFLTSSFEKMFQNLVNIALEAKLNYLVCSPLELKYLKNTKLKTIVPGIRLKKDQANDQQRIATPEEAFAKGACFIVVGRSLTQSENPLETYLKIEEGVIYE